MSSAYRLSLCIVFIFCVSCKFRTSPYDAKIPNLKINSVNMKVIKAKEAQEAVEFKVAFLADTHNYYEEVEKAIDVINVNGPYSFVIIAGDITNQGLLEEYHQAKKSFSRLKYPYLVVVGNHDLLSNGDKIYKKMFGAGNFSFTYRDVEFIIVNNNNWEAAGVIPDIRWFEETLARSAAVSKVVIAHVPYDDSARFPLADIAEWEALLSTYGVNYFINGHNHNPAVSDRFTWKNITIGSPSKKSFLELLITPSGVTHQTKDF